MATPDSSKPITLHKDNLNAQSLDLKDPYVSSSLPFFAIHNVVRRSLLACSLNASSLSAGSPTLSSYLTYANHTCFVLRDQLDSADTIWFPVLTEYNDRYKERIAAHEPLLAHLTLLEAMLKPEGFDGEKVSTEFASLAEAVDQAYDTEEGLTNNLGHKVPMEKIREMEAAQEARRKAVEKEKGMLWSTVFVLKGLTVKEREIFPQGVPKLVLGGILTAGALQYRKELQFAPKFNTT